MGESAVPYLEPRQFVHDRPGLVALTPIPGTDGFDGYERLHVFTPLSCRLTHQPLRSEPLQSQPL